MKVVDWKTEIEYVHELATPAATYRGTYNPSIHYTYGDICIRNDSVWICDECGNFIELGSLEATDVQPKEKTEVEIFFQCRNCGAPTREDGVCAYCGTINRKTKKFSI